MTTTTTRTRTGTTIINLCNEKKWRAHKFNTFAAQLKRQNVKTNKYNEINPTSSYRRIKTRKKIGIKFT